ncbi:MAG TPA: DUF2017 family protein [Actinomycetes bacterium]|nr:DUF2017 family protein [Actinomycetes bacterium]
MAATFKRVGRDRVRVRLGLDEVAVLRDLPGQLREVLAEPGDDPVNRRLFPPAYLEPDDADRDAEYRGLMHDELVQAKLANVEVVAGTLARGSQSMRRWTVDLTEEEATAWLGVLNDLRLALGVRLEITEDFDGQVDDADPRAPAMHLLSYLGWLEEHLLEALSSA